MTVLAAAVRKTNADLILDAVRLGYLKPHDRVLDTTYGNGIWWKKWEPESLFKNNRIFDFRFMPFVNNSFDVVVYDPPYVSIGGRETSTIKEMHERYGMAETPKSPALLQDLMNEGLAECARVTQTYVLMKCQSYISSGAFFNGEYNTQKYAIETLNLKVMDRLIHITKGVRPQPKHVRQVHARNNCSTLFVFKK